MAKPEIIHDISKVGDCISWRDLGGGNLYITAQDGGRFVFMRETASEPVKATFDRSAGPGEPALRVQVEGKHDHLQAVIAVGPVEPGQNEAATRLLAEATLFRNAAQSLGGNYRLERRAAEKIAQAEGLGAAAAVRVVADRQAVKVAGQNINGAPVAVVFGKGESGGGRQTAAETIALGNPREEAKFVRNASYHEAIADQRAQPRPGFIGRTLERIGYVIKGGQDPALARVNRLHERFEAVKSQAGQRIAGEMETIKTAVISKSAAADYRKARESVAGEITSARADAARESAWISERVAADTVHFGDAGGSGGGGGGLVGLVGGLLSPGGGREESGTYSLQGMDTLNRFGPGT